MSLLSSTRKVTTLAPPLPLTNRALNSAGIALRRGQFSLVASAPGVGKSLFATNLVIRTPVPSLYLSADSDEWTVRQRACSILTGEQLTNVDKQLNDELWDGYYTQQLVAIDHVDWCYRTDIDLEMIGLQLNRYAELNGQEDPHLIVIDNLGNTIDPDEGDEYASLRFACRELQKIARLTRAHVMALHHVKGKKEDGFQSIGMGDLLGNIGKIPEVVLGLNRAGENRVNLTVAKNRGGKSNFSVVLDLNYPTATLGGF